MKKWYVVHVQTGREEQVKRNLEIRAQSLGEEGEISRILIPTEDVAEVKGGRRKLSTRKFFPGYILVEMEMNKKVWHLVRNAPGVTGFVSSGDEPTPLKESDVKNIMKLIDERKEAKPRPKVAFQKGEEVKVVEGPFANFSGMVEDVNPEKGKLKISVSIFGRSTPVELEYWQVERV